MEIFTKEEREEAEKIAANISWQDLRDAINRKLIQEGQWGGAPMPVDGAELVLSSRFPYQGLGFKLREDGSETKEDFGDLHYINSWFSWHRYAYVYLYRETKDDPKVKKFLIPANRCGERFRFILNTLGVSSDEAWTVKAELEAVKKLKKHISEHAFKCYMLSGTFIETSKRSGVKYVFRKLRPTVAMNIVDGKVEILCALCIHPLGWYEGTWAGCMVPTDCVLTHLLMMRADEHKYWSKSNQLPVYIPQAGI